MKPLYLALSGGGAHAAAHCGVLKGLEREGIRVAGVAGVSGGALVAAAWAGGADIDQLVEQASRLHPWMWVRGWGGGLLSGSRLGALIDEFVPVDRFEELRVPLTVVATDVDTGEAVVFNEGSLLRDVVRASCSFPGVFPPFSWEGRRLVDGGVSEVVPVRRAREMARDEGVVVAIDCNAGGRWPAADSFIAIALRAGLTMVRGPDAVRADRRRLRDLAHHRRVRLDAPRPHSPLRQSGRGVSRGGAAGAAPSPRRLRRDVRRWIPVLVAAVSLLVALGYALSRYDRPPVPPGSWLCRSGLEARYATVNGHRLRYLRVGRGPAVVLIHGFGSSIYTWKDVLPLLAADHDVVALDLPGFGASDLPPGPVLRGSALGGPRRRWIIWGSSVSLSWAAAWAGRWPRS